MLNPYISVLVALVVAAGIVGTMLGLGRLLGPNIPNRAKLEAFECGNPPSGSAWGRFSVKFYMTAILFIVFDVELVLLYPWAVLFRRLGWFGFGEMLVFVAVLGIALLYVWRKGGLEWD